MTDSTSAATSAIDAALPVQERCALVTVTYGSRWRLLKQSVASALAQGVAHVIVIDNGSTDDIAEHARKAFGTRVETLTNARNRGSAQAFSAGMRRASEQGFATVLLLDDDNELAPGSVECLMETYRRWATRVSRSHLAVVAFRARQVDQAIGLPSVGMFGGSTTAFFGFHILDVPFKIFRRTVWGRRWTARRSMRREVQLHACPYGGMLIGREVLDRFGYPDERFVLYGDDTEFSSRLVRDGGSIVLDTSAALIDLEDSWDDTGAHGNAFDARLAGEGDFRAYYSARNTAYFERHVVDGRGGLRLVNRCLFFALLWWRARRRNCMARFALLRTAIRDGEAKRLGEHPAFPLA